MELEMKSLINSVLLSLAGPMMRGQRLLVDIKNSSSLDILSFLAGILLTQVHHYVFKIPSK